MVSVAATRAPAQTETKQYIAHYLTPFKGPQAYRDPSLPVVFYVESDGRHVTALGLDGKIQWHKDPYADAKLQFYRTNKPVIVFIGPARKSDFQLPLKGRPVGIAFNNSQFGVIDSATGTFTFLGQD
jgi:hypothetical protein